MPAAWYCGQLLKGSLGLFSEGPGFRVDSGPDFATDIAHSRTHVVSDLIPRSSCPVQNRILDRDLTVRMCMSVNSCWTLTKLEQALLWKQYSNRP